MSKSAASRAGSVMVKRRYAKMSAEDRSKAASRAASASWEGLTADERKAEMRRIISGKGRRRKGTAA